MCKYFKLNDRPVPAHSLIIATLGVVLLGSTFLTNDVKVTKLISGLGTLMLFLSVVSLFIQRTPIQRDVTIPESTIDTTLLTNEEGKIYENT